MWTGPMSFAPMAASSRMYKGYHNLLRNISFQLFFRLTISWNDPVVPPVVPAQYEYHEAADTTVHKIINSIALP